VSGAHTLRHKPIRLHMPVIRFPWRKVGAALMEVADVLWMCVIAAVTAGLAAGVITLVAFGLYQTGQRDAAVVTVAIGFALIVVLLILWAERECRK
jgi:hypothetical protein